MSSETSTDRKNAEEALRESESRYRLLLQNVNDAVYVHSISPEGPGRFLEVNDEACRMLGYTREEFLKMSISDIDVSEQTSRVPDILDKQFKDGHAMFETEERAKDGRRIPVEVNARIFEFQNKPCVLAVVRDISERNKLQAQLNQAQKMESVGRLAGGVAHDFNNMLGVILGHAELAMEGVEPAFPVHADLEEIQKAAQRSVDLTRQLLAFARRQTAQPKIMDLNDTITGMLKMLRRLIGEDIDLAWMPAANLWPVKIDPAQIDQILANLCVNARDAISGVGKVTIGTQNITLDDAYCVEHPECISGDYVMLSVSDDGCGMDKETLKNLFEPFFTTKEVGKGTGLGLATVYGIVKQNDGFIYVYSEPGQGTTFKIYLPRTQEIEKEKETVVSKEISKGTEIVLLVEDEESILRLGKVVLERFGYTVLAARTPGRGDCSMQKI